MMMWLGRRIVIPLVLRHLWRWWHRRGERRGGPPWDPRSTAGRRLLVSAVSLALVSACSDDNEGGVDDVAEDVGDAVNEGTNDAIEAAARNIASAQGEDEFSAADVDIEGDLTCEATVGDAADALDIRCAGQSTEGQELVLTGTTDEVPGASVTELEGTFVGSAEGAEVFKVDTLGG